MSRVSRSRVFIDGHLIRGNGRKKIGRKAVFGKQIDTLVKSIGQSRLQAAETEKRGRGFPADDKIQVTLRGRLAAGVGTEKAQGSDAVGGSNSGNDLANL